ncbi:sigma-70 family RNA polymerase sigma factor [Aeoliella sp.]|uniref:sigma-70 family RNA polymerase sigma factor n=1 Tax=Aeoliella sp. TaxID=2795800 RepID=UPI003CCBAB51
MNQQSQFLELYLAHEQELRTCIRALVRNYSEYEDVFQVVVLRLWEKFSTYDADRPFGPWARGVAVREVLEARRKDGKRPTPFSPEAVQAILDTFESYWLKNRPSSDRMEALEQCVDSLRERQKQLLGLRYSDGLRMSELARRLGRTAAATQRELSRLRERLADCIRRRLAPESGGSK